MPDNLNAFTRAYIECALWSSTDDAGETLEHSEAKLAPETLTTMIADCAAFQTAHAALLSEAYELGEDDARAGHDFWLTRNRHGAGFWDRGLGGVGDKLTDAAHETGERDLYVGDDGLIYQ
jgi:hypothetical protein